MDIREYVAAVVVPRDEKDRDCVYSFVYGFRKCPQCKARFKVYHNCGYWGLYIITIDRKIMYFFWGVKLIKMDGLYQFVCIRHGMMGHVEQKDGINTKLGIVKDECIEWNKRK